jgi:hypothetical protein
VRSCPATPVSLARSGAGAGAAATSRPRTSAPSQSAFLIFQPVKFATLYSFANVVSIAGTMFLAGPMKQLKNMFARTRIIATLVFLTMIGVTIFVAVKTQNVGLTILCLAVQFLAFVWYTLSYIPFARNAVLGCCKGVVGST